MDTHLAHTLQSSLFLVEGQYMQSVLAHWLINPPATAADNEAKQPPSHSATYMIAQGMGFSESTTTEANTIAVHRKRGMMLKSDSWWYGQGMNSLGLQIQAADADDNVIAHVLDLDTPGGTVDGTFELADIIANTSKPIICYVNGLTASAGMALAASCKSIVASSKTAALGSIGVCWNFYSYEGMYAQMGIEEIFVTADGSEDKQKDYREALKGKHELAKINQLNPIREHFVSMVKDRRPQVSAEALTAAMYIGDNALAMGLVDDFMSWDNTLQYAYSIGISHKSKTAA